MKNRILSLPVVMMATLALMAGAAVAQAQDRSNQPSDQPTTASQHQNQQSDQRQQRDRSTKSAPAPAERPAPPRRVASANQDTDLARYRREHPHAAARCHDGFFTNTTDRARACSKHGGIEIWLLP